MNQSTINSSEEYYQLRVEVCLMLLTGLKPCGVLCEITNPDGTMARLPELRAFSEKYGIPMVTVQDIIKYRNAVRMN